APRREEPGRGRAGRAAADDEHIYQVLGIYARTYRESMYSVGSGTPASRNASWRSRHLLQTPQWRGAGFMHDSVTVKSTPSERPRRTTSAFVRFANGASISIGRSRPSDNARAMVARNSGVASGNGLWASV